jgi:transposase
MMMQDHKPEDQTAIRTDLGAIFVSLELSRSTWLVASLSPGDGEKMSKHSVPGGDISGLLMLFSRLTERARKRAGEECRIYRLAASPVHRLMAVSVQQYRNSLQPVGSPGR